MFTGLVQVVGKVTLLERSAVGARLELSLPGWALEDGESVAVNGCCLTDLPGVAAAFDLSPETLTKTNLGSLSTGDAVNIERALKMGDAVGGHLMAGHVDGLAQLVGIEAQGDGAEWTVEAPAELARFIATKGSVALDGVSLTPFDVSGTRFKVALIPHTLANTNFRERKAGDRLNLEVDLLARYVQRLQEAQP